MQDGTGSSELKCSNMLVLLRKRVKIKFNSKLQTLKVKCLKVKEPSMWRTDGESIKCGNFF